MKKIFSVNNLISLLYLIGNIGFIFIILLPISSLNFRESLVISGLLGWVYTRMEVNSLELKNQIFELKEMLKNECGKK